MDRRTVLGFLWHTVKNAVGTGMYIPFGLEKRIQRAVETYQTTPNQKIKSQLHFDGIRLFRGSSQKLWPILAPIIQPLSPVFIVGPRCEMNKPSNIGEYMVDLISELRIPSFGQRQSNRVLNV